MGNEASAEGGDGGLPAVPGAAAEPDGGAPAATETGRDPRVEDRRTARTRGDEPPGAPRDAPAHRAALVDAKQPSKEPGSPPTQGSSGISKSRTVDAFGTGPVASQTTPGRSPSSVSLLESQSRPRGKEEPRKRMFSSNFLSGANPLSAVSSAVNKFSLFGDEAAAEEAVSSSLSSSSEDEEEGASKQKPPQQRGGKASAPGKAPQQQQGSPRPGQGSPQQRGHPQQTHAKPGPQKQGPPGAQSQGASKSGGQPQQGPAKGGSQQPRAPGKPGPEAGPAKARAPPPGPGNVSPKSQGPTPGAQKSLCPLCKTAELNLHTKEQPNYCTCTQCNSVVCSLCGFSPPDSTVKEWLCLNCQMQRALGGMDPPGPPMMKPQSQSSKQAPKQGPTPGPLQTKQASGQASAPSSPQTKKASGQASAPSSPQTKKAPGQDSAPSSPQTKQTPLAELSSNPGTSKPIENRKPSPLTRQESVTDAGQSATPPAAKKGPASPTPDQPKPGPLQVEKPVRTPVEGEAAMTKDPLVSAPHKQPPGQSASQQTLSGSPKLDPKLKHPLQDPGRPTQQMAKGGTGPPSAKSSLAPQAQPPKQESSFFGLSFGGFTEATKPQSTDPQSAAESVTGKLFGFGGFTEPPKPQPTGPQPAAESVTGKLFGFGGITEAAKPQTSAPQPADSVSGKVFGFGSSIFSSASNLITSAVQDEHPPQPSPKTPVALQQGKAAPSHETRAVSEKAEKPSAEPPRRAEITAPSPKVSQLTCPLCKVELNVGSKDPPNYNTCTECKNTVCNLCGFNPMPHLHANEWLCLNCQTQRALAGQLGDIGRMQPPAPAPSKPVGQQSAVQVSKSLTTPETTQAAASVSTEHVATKPQEKMDTAAEKTPATDTSELANTKETVAAPSGSVSYPESASAPAVASFEMHPAPLEKVAAPQLTPVSADTTATPDVTIHSEITATQEKTALFELTSPPVEESDASHTDPASVLVMTSAQSSESEAACLEPQSTSESAFALPKSPSPPEAVDTSPQPSEFITHPDSKVAPPVDSVDVLKNDSAVTNLSDFTEAGVSLQEPSGFTEPVRDAITCREPTTPSEDTTLSAECTNTTEAIYTPQESEVGPPEVFNPSLEGEIASEETFPPETMAASAGPNAIPSESVVAPDNVTILPSEHATEAVFDPSEPQVSPPQSIIPSLEGMTPDDNSVLGTVSSPLQAEAVPLEPSAATPTVDTSPEPIRPCEAVTAPAESKTVHCYPVATHVDGVDPPEPTPATEAATAPAVSETVVPEVVAALQHDDAPPEAEAAYAESVVPEPTSTSEAEGTSPCATVSPSEECEAVPPEPTVLPEGTTPETTILAQVITSHQEPEVVPLEAVAPIPRSTSSSEAISALLESEAPPKPASPPEIVAAHSELTLSPEAVVAPVELEAAPPRHTVSPKKPVYPEIAPPAEVVTSDSPESETTHPDATPPSGKIVDALSEHTAVPPQLVSMSPSAMELSRMKTVEETEEKNTKSGTKREIMQPVPQSQVVSPASPQPDAAPQHVATPPPEKTVLSEPVYALSQLISATSPPTKELSRMKTVEVMEEEIIQEVAKEEEKQTSVEVIVFDGKVASDSSGLSQKYLQDITDSSCVSASLSDDPAVKKEMLAELAAHATSVLVTRQPPLDLGKLESRVEVKETLGISHVNNLEKDIHRPKTLSISAKSHPKGDGVPGEVQIKEELPCTNAPGAQPYHSEKDSQGEAPSLSVQGRDKVAKDHPHDSLHSGDDEEFIRKEIMEMRINEDVVECTQQQKPRQDESKEESTSGQSKLLFQKSIITKEEDSTEARNKEEIFCREDGHDFKIEIENTTTVPHKTLGPTQGSADWELEMESLTNSPEDRSRGEGSSSLHASSFTPGTSPTSMSSMDEDSDSSPSHKRLGEEGKQRKARHRQHILPTIEDSSEEEELREEELLREQDRQQEMDEQHLEKRSSSRKSKRGKEELRTQWRREHPITPTRNLSPIEDASPTEELRQAVEMEELHKSSANSPCAESAPDRLESNAEKFATFQTMYEPPLSVSLYSPSDEKTSAVTKGTHNETVGSRVESNKTSVQEPVKKLRSADEAYEDIMQKRTELLKQKEIHQSELVNETFQQHTVLPAVSETCYVTVSSGDTVHLERDKNTVTANEEQIEQEKASVVPTMTLNQATPVLHKSPEVAVIPSRGGGEDDTLTAVIVSGKKSEPESIDSSGIPLIRTLYPIPDLKITQCSSGEEDIEDETISSPDIPQIDQTVFKIREESVTSDTPTTTRDIGSVEMDPVLVICETPQLKIIRNELSGSVVAPTLASAEMEPISVICEVPQPMTVAYPLEGQDLHAAFALSVLLSPPSAATEVVTGAEMQPMSPVCATSVTAVSSSATAPKLTSVLDPARTKQTSVISEASQPPAHVSAPVEVPLRDPGSVSDLSEITVVCEIPQPKDTPASASVTVSAPELTPPASNSGLTPDPHATLAPSLTPAVEPVSAVDLSQAQASFVSPVSQDQPPPVLAQLPLTAQVQSVVVDMQHSVDYSNVVESTSVPPHPQVVSHVAPTPTDFVLSPVIVGKEQMVTSAPGRDHVSLVDHSTKDIDVSPVGMTTLCLTAVATSQDYSPASTASFSSPMSAAVVSVSPFTAQPQRFQPSSTVSAINSDVVHSALTSVPLSALYRPPLPSCSPNETLGALFKTPSPSLPATQLPAPPSQPEPSVCPKDKAPASTISVTPSVATVPVSTVVTMAYATITTAGPSTMAPTYKPQVFPSVPLSPQSAEIGPCLFPKPAVTQPTIAGQNIKNAQPTVQTPHIVDAMTLNLVAPAECKITAASPKSPLSPRFGNSLHETYVVITLPSEPGSPSESVTTQASISQPAVAPSKAVDPTVPVAITQYTKSIESQEIWGPDKVVSSTSRTFSSVSTSGQSCSTPNRFTKVLTTEVQRTTVSVVCETVLPAPVSKTSSVAISIPPETTSKAKPKENGKVHYSGNVVDLRTLKLSVAMTEKGMDLSSPDSRRQSFSSDSSGRQTSAVQSSVVNLSAEIPASTLSFVTDTITIVTCTATIAYNGTGDRLVTKGPAMPAPLQLTTKTFEPVAQIVYRPVNSKPVTGSTTDVPINLSFGAVPSIEMPKLSGSESSVSPMNGTNGFPAHSEAGVMGAVDLTTRPVQMVASLKESTSKVITSVIEEDGKPVDLTGGRRAVCCDVVYKFPFASICRAPQPATTLPEDRFGYRDDHYQYSRARLNGTKGFSGMKPSMSDTNLVEAGLFFYKSKNSYDYRNGATEGAVDLTSGKISKGEVTGYSNGDAGRYSGTNIAQYSQTIPAGGPHFGVNSILKYSDGVVYSSVSAPLPSPRAITTQPVSIFGSGYKDFSGMDSSGMMQFIQTLQSQTHPQSYNFLSSTATTGGLQLDAGMTKETLSSPFSSVVPTVTEIPSAYIDGSLETITAPMQALATSVLLGPEGRKDQQYEMEREILELEKVKQQRMAEEIEWERQEIKRFREQEQLIVQQELEKLQTMKQQLLYQQEEERQAHLIMQQETYAQHQLQLEQIHQLQQQLQQHLEEQKIRQIYSYDPSEADPSLSSAEQILQGQRYLDCDNGQFWPVQDVSAVPSVFTGFDLSQKQAWLPVPTQGVSPHSPSVPGSEQSVKESNGQNLQLSNQVQSVEGQHNGHKKIDSGVQTDGEDIVDRAYAGRRRRSRKSVDSSVQTDDEDQDGWDVPARSRRRSRSSRYVDGEKGKQASKLSSIAIQTVAEISVQTDPSGSLKRPSVRAHVDTKIELSSPDKAHRGSTLSSERKSPQRDKKRPTPLEITYSTHLKADSSSLQVTPSPPKSPKVLYSPISPLSPRKSLEYAPYEKAIRDSSPQKIPAVEPSKVSPKSPQAVKGMQRSALESKTSSPTADEQAEPKMAYSDGHVGKGSQSSASSVTQKKVRRTLPNPPQEEEAAGVQASYSTGSARRRLCRNITMARAKILQDIDRELDLVERESSKLRQKQAELDEEEKEIDARLRYLEMGINRRRDALLKEREKRERDYLQGVAEERDYMSDSEVSNLREKRRDSHGLERPKTAPQSELNKFIPPQTEPTSPYTQYQYTPPTQASQQTRYQQSSFYDCQQTSPYQSIYSSVPTPSYPQSSHQRSQPRGYQHASQTQMIHQKPRQTMLTDLEPKITTNYEVIRNQPVVIGPSSADTAYGLSHLGSKYSSLNLRMGLDERSSVASSPMSSISADSFYADIDHHTPKNYLLFNDMSEITKGSTGLSSNFSIPDKDIAKADRLLRAAEMRDYLGPLQASSRLHPCMKVQEDAMEEPYELKLLKQQIKQEFRRNADGLDPLTGLHQYYPSDSSYRHFHKAEKYSIGRLTLEKQAAKQLPASVLYQKQAKYRKSFIDPKITKFSPIQECRDIGLDYSSFVTPSTAQVSGLASRTRLLQDDISFGLRKSIAEQQKYLGSTLAQSLNLGQSLSHTPHLRSSLQDDTVYPSGSRSRPSSRPSSVYGLDLSIKRDLSSSSLRLKMENDGTSLVRTKPSNLPISQSRGRIPIVAQNSEEESPLSPVGQPMGMARASAGPLPPISADLRDQFGSSHSLPEVQQHMREESRTRAYDRDIAFLMDDMQGAMSDGEAHHLRQEETDWFNKPHEVHRPSGLLLDHKQVSHKQIRQHGEMKPSLYPFPHTRVKIQRDPRDRSVSGNGLGMRVVGGKEIPENPREIGAYVASVVPGGATEQTGKIVEGMQILEWNGVSLTGKTYEEVQGILSQPCGETEICVRLDLNMLSDPGHPQCLELQDQAKPGPAGDRQRSPGVDPNQLTAELQKVSQQQAPSGMAPGALEKGLHVQSGVPSAASSAVHSPGRPGSPSVNKKRQASKPAEAAKTQTHPITGDIQLQLNYDRNVGNLIVHVLQARNLAPRDNNGYSDPFVKVYLLPGRSQVMVVQNASAENKRRSKSSQRSLNPEWNQTVIYKNIHLEQLKKKTLEVTVWDYDRFSSNDFLGEVLIDLSNTAQLDNMPRWLPVKEQSETLDHGRPRSGQGIPQPPKPSVIKSRSHGIFPDPSKDMQLPTIEKSHSSPGSSKSSSEGHLRSHGPSRSQSKSSVSQSYLEDAGVAIAATEAAVQQLRYQPTRPGHRPTEAPVKTVPAVTNLILEEEGGADAVDSAIFQIPQIGKTIPNGTDKIRGADPADNEGKTQVMGEIKIALKKETKTEGEQLIVEILQCRNITYKFKSPDHLPDLYVKLYVVNVATQKKLIKKKTRVCRHDREPSFNETFRFTLNPTGHSLQLFLVSNGGKFVKKTLVGEAYVWLDKVDLRKRTTSWHKLLASSPQSHP